MAIYRCMSCGGNTQVWGMPCQECIRLSRLTEALKGGGGGAEKNSQGCAAFLAWIFGICLAVMAFHAPFGYFVWKRLDISPGEATYASVRCIEGWIGSSLIWASLAGLVYGLVELCRKNGAKTFFGAAILAGFSTWFVWSNMEAIRDSHNAIKAEEAAEAAKNASIEGGSTQPQTKHSEPAADPPPNTGTASATGAGRSSGWGAAPSNTSTSSKASPEISSNHPVQVEKHLPQTEPRPIVPSVSSRNQKENKFNDPPNASKTTNIAAPQSRQPDQPSALIEIESTDGRRIRAKILVLTGSSVLLRRDDGKEFEIPLSRLTELSKQKIYDWRDAKKHSNSP